MSGGVDSSVVAKLLIEQDYDLSAIYMRNWDTRDETGSDNGCEWKKDYADVQKVCKMLDIPCKLVSPIRKPVKVSKSIEVGRFVSRILAEGL